MLEKRKRFVCTEEPTGALALPYLGLTESPPNPSFSMILSDLIISIPISRQNLIKNNTLHSGGTYPYSLYVGVLSGLRSNNNLRSGRILASLSYSLTWVAR